MKKIYRITVLMLLVGQIFLFFPCQIALATSQTGFDYIKEGDRYEYKSTSGMKTIYKESRSNELISSEISYQSEIEFLIRNVDKDGGYMIILQLNYYTAGEYNYTASIPQPYFHYYDEDSDGYVESLSAYPASNTFLLCTWDDYSKGHDTFKEELANASNDLTNFKYSFTIEPQRLEIKVEYKLEDYFWDDWDPYSPFGLPTEGSIIYNVESEIIVSYNNFILNEVIEKEKITVNSIVNASYLLDNNITYIQEQSYEYTVKLQGFFEKYGFWLILGIGIALTAVSIVVAWKKREGLGLRIKKIKKRKAMGSQIKRRNRWFDKGTEFAVSGEFDKAIQCYVAFLKSNPQDYEAWYYKGAAYECLGNYKKAVECFEKALDIQPEFMEAINSKNEVLKIIEEGEKTKKTAENPAKLESFENDMVSIHEKVTKTCPYCKNEMINDVGICMNCGRHIIEHAEESPLEKENSVEFVPDKDSIKDVNEMSDIGEKIEENFNELFNIGIDYAFEENYQKAIEMFDKIIKLDPQSYGAWYNKGLMFENLGETKQAINCYDEAIKIKPDFKVAIKSREDIIKNQF